VEANAYQRSGRVPSGFLWFGDDTIYNWWPYAYDVTDLPENYIEGEEFAPLRELIKITDDDIHTMDVIYAEDMRTIRRYQEGKFLLMEGRLLKEQDTAEKNPVCVISDVFADYYDLKVGDKISLKLGDKLFENYAPLGAVASFRERYAENFTEEQEFEIVGLYHETGLEDLKVGERYWAYSENAIFVPQSFLPVSDEALAEWALSPSDVSFIVSSADDIMAFADEGLPMLDEKGYVTYYSDGGWPEISKQLQQTGLLSLLKLAAFSAAVVLVLLLTMYLFVIQRRNEFAVMRALGCPKKNAVAVLLFPLSMLAVIGVALGTGLALCYTVATIGDKLQSYAKFGIPIDESIPAAAVVLSVVGCFALLMIFAAAGLVYIARLNPLELLQGGQRAKKDKRKTEAVPETPPVEMNISVIRDLEPFEQKKKPAAGFMWRYIRRHASRSAGKSLLLILATALLIGAMGQFAAVRNSYRELYESVDIKVRFLDFEHYKAKEFAETDFVNGGYFEYVFNSGELPHDDDAWQALNVSYCLSNDLLYRVSEDITFLEGYDAETVMEQNERICIMPRYMMEWLGVELGDKVELNERMYLAWITAMHINTLGEEGCIEMYRQHSVKATVVGCIETMKDTVYIPLPSKGYYQTMFSTNYLTLAEYSLADYHKAIELRTYAKSLIEPTYQHQPRFSMDTAEADRVYNTYQMIETLYPIAFVTAVLIGAIIMGLLVLQRAKEAATLRILGATNRRTRTLLAIEQILLCILGLVLALAALLSVNGAELMKTAASIGVYLAVHVAACVIGCVAGAIGVTRHKALELLQVKE
ncbi:MAG: ABC transporter permease, partial [Oscillospiraceae bacterium]|nr:ABC transporter permease [Oscillospiraceae bacterium]